MRLISMLVTVSTLLLLPPNLPANFQDQPSVIREKDHEWASKAGLSPETMDELRSLADDEDGMTDNLDAVSLKARNHVLLVTAGGNGHCLRLYVFNRRGSGFRLIQSISELPSGAGFCRQSPLSPNPEAYVSSKDAITVKVPIVDSEDSIMKRTDVFAYNWNGKRYQYAGHKVMREKIR